MPAHVAVDQNDIAGLHVLRRDFLIMFNDADAGSVDEQSVALADRSSDEFQMMGYRTTYADALHAAGRREAAALAFADAELDLGIGPLAPARPMTRRATDR